MYFYSTYLSKIDKKNRISIPSAFLKNIDLNRNRVFLLNSLSGNKCLEVHLEKNIENFVATINKSFKRNKSEEMQLSIFSELEEINIDKSGRFVLREIYKDFSKLSEQITFMGKGFFFEIWNSKLAREYKDDARKFNSKKTK